MTLNDLLDYTAAHPDVVLFYFALIPFAALLAGFMERREGHLPPWNYLYSAMLYLVAIPAVLSVALLLDQLFFGHGTVTGDYLLLQWVPIVSFFCTAYIIRQQVYLRGLPGFGRLGGLVLMILATLLILWAIDSARLVPFSGIHIQYTVAAFLLLLILVRVGWRKAFASA